jgi:thymidylate kinase
LDCPVSVAFNRKIHFDNIENRGVDYFERVRNGYLELSKMFDNWVILDSTTNILDKTYKLLSEKTCQLKKS